MNNVQKWIAEMDNSKLEKLLKSFVLAPDIKPLWYEFCEEEYNEENSEEIERDLPECEKEEEHEYTDEENWN